MNATSQISRGVEVEDSAFNGEDDKVRRLVPENKILSLPGVPNQNARTGFRHGHDRVRVGQI
jgi:hypothetical protein